MLYGNRVWIWLVLMNGSDLAVCLPMNVSGEKKSLSGDCILLKWAPSTPCFTNDLFTSSSPSIALLKLRLISFSFSLNYIGCKKLISSNSARTLLLVKYLVVSEMSLDLDFMVDLLAEILLEALVSG